MFGDPVKNPFGWPTMTLDQATKEIVSGQCLNGDAGKLQPGQKAVLKVSAVTYGSFDANEYKVLRDTKQITKGIYPQKGDLLFSRANTREYVGATVLIDQDYPELMLPDKLWKLIFKHEIMPMFAKQFDDSIEINFNVNQIQEEKKKIEFLTQNPDCTDEVFELEDHNMLKGQIGIIGLDNLSLGSRFSSLFACSWDKIDCALMTLGNYGQQERNKWRYQFASKSLQYAWDELFHKSANAGFENTHTILVELLKSKESFDDGILDGIISAFLAQCEKDNLYPWNYYYVKYPVFRPGSYGKMSNDDVVNKPYMFSVMQTKTQWSQNTYMPYLKEADDDHLSRDEMGQYLVYDDVYIVCENNSYGVYRNDDDSLTDTVTISQNEAGIDTEDRIIKLKKYIANMK